MITQHLVNSCPSQAIFLSWLRGNAAPHRCAFFVESREVRILVRHPRWAKKVGEEGGEKGGRNDADA